MAAYDIRVIGDPVLRQKAKDVTDIDGALVQVVDDMLETMYEAPGIGLAAPQVGINKRLFVWDIGMGPNAMVNPEIVESDGEWVFEEGCLSVPDIYDEVERPARCRIRYMKYDGEQIDEWAEGLYAVCIQHEMDHLEGTLFIDHLSRLKRQRAVDKVKKAKRLKEKNAA